MNFELKNFYYYILGFLTIFLIIYLLNEIENFDSSNADCRSISKGPCTSSLCPTECKINISDDGNSCYCVNRE